MLLQVELLIFSNSWKILIIGILEYFQVFPNSLNSCKIGIFSFIFIFCQIVGIVFQAGYVCRVRDPIVIM